jgi:hypothetical protein
LYRLITTVLDFQQAPAKELAALYHERWEIETTLDELKTHLRGAQIVLRSKTPEPVGFFVGLQGSLVHQTADGKMRHQQTEELLSDQLSTKRSSTKSFRSEWSRAAIGSTRAA